MDESRTILLVEDNPADIYLVQRVVEECGSDIPLFVVPDGGEALAFLRKEGPFAYVPSPALILRPPLTQDARRSGTAGNAPLTGLSGDPDCHL